tara:strand:- start:375 stop:584 length:210 start_codon:yes stop_codon:yes gene_type:complete
MSRFPEVVVQTNDSFSISINRAAKRAARRAGLSPELIAQYDRQAWAQCGGDHLVRVTQDWFTLPNFNAL